MEVNEIIDYFARNWQKVEGLLLKRGLENSFYPVVFPDGNDFRLINPNAPALKSDSAAANTWTRNPLISHFEGLILEELIKAPSSKNGDIVDITYLSKRGVYFIQCLKETSPATDNEFRYVALSIPKQTIAPEEELQKAYNKLSPLLK